MDDPAGVTSLLISTKEPIHKKMKDFNRIPRTGAYLRPSKNKPPCELAILRDIAN